MNCMACSRCGTSMAAADARDYAGQVICEDCYMEALSPLRTCDPWAVHLAPAASKTARAGISSRPGNSGCTTWSRKRGRCPFPTRPGPWA